MVTTLATTILLKTAGGSTLVTATNDPAAGVCLISAGPSEVRRRRASTTSPWVAGEVELSSVDDAATYSLSVRVSGANWAAVDAAVQAVKDAVRQRAWILTETAEGVTTTYSCYAADVSVPREGVERLNRKQVLTATIPLAP